LPLYRLNPSNWQIISTADFNNDGIADILWRNQASGQNAIWEMKRDFTLQSGRFITPLADSNWQIVGTGDFNHDGIADLVWRNQDTGQNAIWQMNSTDVETGYYLTSVADSNWQIAGIADFDGDGSPDLLWRNAQASKVGFWQMKGFTESQTYFLPDVSSDWVVRPLRTPQASAPS
jgi:5-hydroxyisourate hydrolase-like protein (transthyretin family)